MEEVGNHQLGGDQWDRHITTGNNRHESFIMYRVSYCVLAHFHGFVL